METGRLIDADALARRIREVHCADCDRRKGLKRGKKVILYDIGSTPCRACYMGSALEYLEDEDAAPTVDAIPVEWLLKKREQLRKEQYGRLGAVAITKVLWYWDDEQEAKTDA